MSYLYFPGLQVQVGSLVSNFRVSAYHASDFSWAAVVVEPETAFRNCLQAGTGISAGGEESDKTETGQDDYFPMLAGEEK